MQSLCNVIMESLGKQWFYGYCSHLSGTVIFGLKHIAAWSKRRQSTVIGCGISKLTATEINCTPLLMPVVHKTKRF
jgi:hypothetical protein